MSLGNKINSILILFFLMSALSYSEDKITSSPLINLDNIKPSFENLNEENETLILKKNIKEKQKSKNSIKSSHAVLIGLDKITAKSSQLIINLNEPKKFGPLEIRILKY